MHDELTLTGLLDLQVERRSDVPAMYYRGATTTYAALAAESRRVARGLSSLGVGRGDRVSLWLPNTPAWFAAFFACARLGAIALATNTRFRAAEMEDILGRSEAKVLLYWPAFRGIDFSAILEALTPQSIAGLRAIVAYQEPGEPDPPAAVHGIPVHAYSRLAASAALEEDAASPELGCLMFTTSGTTKAPKFVLHNQRSIVRHALDVAAAFGYTTPGSVGMGVVPFCGTYGFSTAISPIAAGAPLVVDSSFDAERASDLVQRYRITNTNWTRQMVEQMIALPNARARLASLRFCGCGSNCVDVIDAADAAGLRLTGLYGSSEVQALFSHQNEIEAPLAERAQGGGRPIAPGARVRARDVTTGAVLPHGESGELEIRAPSQLMEYFGNAEATRAAFTDDGYFRTGDLGHTLADGRFIFQARMGDVLRLSGFLVSPIQIESVLVEHPAVQACQVVGVEIGAQTRPFAFIIARAGANIVEAELIAFARERMARYKVPVRVVRLDAFPTAQSANAVKVQKAKLREMALALNTQSS